MLSKNKLIGDLESSFYSRINGSEYENWLYFIALKSNITTLKNRYLRFVLEKTIVKDNLSTNVLTAIIDIPHTDERFPVFYSERKDMLKDFPDADVAGFVTKNRKYKAESIYKLTDTKKTEREEIIAWVSLYGWIPQIANIYPAFATYMKKYVFNCTGELSELFTNYFDSYKRQKVSNVLEEDFLANVDELAITSKFKQLPTREKVIENISQENTYLLWVDALGVEFLSLITELANKKGLLISVHIAQAELPTITMYNESFFEKWNDKKRKKIEYLDDTKHDPDKSGYSYDEHNALPIHLAKELDIIVDAIERAKIELKSRNSTKVLIASDHGASRLAVLRRKEEKYKTDEESKIKGKYSGRCCKIFENHDLPFAITENGYLVLADYGRFKGSRAANVEVHGGASLEEVVIPIIELTLKNDEIVIEMLDEDKGIPVDRNKGIKISLFSETPVEQVSLIVKGKRYMASPVGTNHFDIVIPDIKKVEKNPIPADVYAGGKPVKSIKIKTQSKLGNDNSDDFF